MKGGKIPANAGRAKGLANLRVGGGRPPGVPNKATIVAREAIGQLVDANVPKMAGWLEQIEKKHGPLMAWKCLETMVEFAVPKLVRSEATVKVERPEGQLTDDELASAIDHFRMLRRREAEKDSAKQGAPQS